MVNRDQKYSFSVGVIFQKMDDEALLVNLPTEEIFQLNETGLDAVGLLDKGLSFKEILDTLTQSYDVAYPDLERDVSNLFTELVTRNLISKK